MSKLTITVKNIGTKTFVVNFGNSLVKTKGGTYRRIGGGMLTCVPNDTVSIVDSALFAADADRRYLICTTEGSNEGMHAHPNDTGWTSDSTPLIKIER